MEQALCVAGALCIVLALAELLGWPVGVLVLGVLLIAGAYGLHTQARPADDAPTAE